MLLAFPSYSDSWESLNADFWEVPEDAPFRELGVGRFLGAGCLALRGAQRTVFEGCALVTHGNPCCRKAGPSCLSEAMAWPHAPHAPRATETCFCHFLARADAVHMPAPSTSGRIAAGQVQLLAQNMLSCSEGGQVGESPNHIR